MHVLYVCNIYLTGFPGSWEGLTACISQLQSFLLGNIEGMLTLARGIWLVLVITTAAA